MRKYKTKSEMVMTPVYMNKNNRNYTFDHAVYYKCSSFRDILGKINSILPFNIPAKVVLEESFQEEGNRQIIYNFAPVFQSKYKNAFDSIHTGALENTKKNMSSISEIKIEGNDLDKIEFYPTLNDVSLQKELRNKYKPILDFIGPNLERIEDEISH